MQLASISNCTTVNNYHEESWISPNYLPSVVSIIIPTYNRATLLRETLESVWHQTYRPIEVIVVDDGSIDETLNLLRNWSDARQSVDFSIIYKRQQHSGVSAARNHGTKISSGEFIQYLDSDDLLHPRSVERAIECLGKYHDHDGVALHHCLFKGNANPNFEDIKTPLSSRNTVGLRITDCFSGFIWSYLFRREVIFLNGSWYEELGHYEDLEYLLRISQLKHLRFVQLQEKLVAYRDHTEERLSNSAEYRGLFEGMESLFNNPASRKKHSSALMREYFAPIYRRLFANAASQRDYTTALLILRRLAQLSNSKMKSLKYALKYEILSRYGWRGYFLFKF